MTCLPLTRTKQAQMNQEEVRQKQQQRERRQQQQQRQQQRHSRDFAGLAADDGPTVQVSPRLLFSYVIS